jgi:hypothetical protein
MVPRFFGMSDMARIPKNATRQTQRRVRGCSLFTTGTFLIKESPTAFRALVVMSIRAYLDREGFDPETVRLMGLAFEMALASLRPPYAEPLREAVAQKIIALAKAGERDPERLCEGAFKELPTVASASLLPTSPRRALPGS